MNDDPLDRAILAALKDGPITGSQLVERMIVSRLVPSIELFNAHLADLIKRELITCSRPGDPKGEWSLVPPKTLESLERPPAQHPGMVELLKAAPWNTRVKPLLDAYCTGRERELIHMLHDGKTLSDAAQHYSITQAALSYRLDRALQKLFDFPPVLKPAPEQAPPRPTPTPEEMIAWFDQLATHTRSQPAKSIVLSPLDLQDLVRAAHQQPAGLLSAKDGTMVYRNNTTLYEAANQPPGTMRITYGATTLDVTAHSPLHLYREGLAWK